MNKLTYIILSFSAVALSSCWLKSSGDNTGIEYAPDMYYSKGYEPMTQFSDSSKYRFNPYFMTMREPVKGTIANGQLDYQYAFDNTNDGYNAAAAALMMPTDLTEKEQLNGERNFLIYCSVCHGEKGGNDGKVSTKQAVLKPAWANMQTDEFKSKTPGAIYHVLTYGKNNMGSYAYALTPRDRWAVISYVERLKQMDSTGKIPGIKGVISNNNMSVSEASQYDLKQEVRLDAALETKLNTIVSHIEFETGSNNIKKSSQIELDELAKILLTISDKVTVIKGHTDNVGESDKNIILSDERAEAVKAYLISKGVKAENIQAIGFGSMYPKADNNTEAGKQANRRVEIGFKNK